MLKDKSIYLDNNATTALDPRVFEVMQKEYLKGPSNPSSIHRLGQEAKNSLAKSRRLIADILGVFNGEIVFTSGGTEAVHLGIKGIASKLPKGHIITSAVEHKAVLSTLGFLEKEGFTVSYLKPCEKGHLSLEEVQREVRDNTVMIALMAANNETGVITEDLEKIASFAKERKICFFVDAISSFGKGPFSIPEGVSALSLAAHKFHGPKGAGLLYIKQGTPFEAQLLGGAQEYGMRAGTENLAAILGMAKAMEIVSIEGAANIEKLKELQRCFEESVCAIDGVLINGSSFRLANTSNVYFEGIEGESLLMNLDLQGVCVSHGSACTSGALEPSHVLTAMGYSQERVRSSVRFSFSKFNNTKEIEIVISLIKSILGKLRY